jgi:hypothetical protein
MHRGKHVCSSVGEALSTRPKQFQFEAAYVHHDTFSLDRREALCGPSVTINLVA